jgi:hypothetical protein
MTAPVNQMNLTTSTATARSTADGIVTTTLTPTLIQASAAVLNAKVYVGIVSGAVALVALVL